MSAPVGHVTDDRLIDLSAGLLDEGGRAHLLQHLKECPECEDRFLEVARHAARLETTSAPPQTRAGLSARRLPLWFGMAAAAAIVLLGASVLLRRPVADGLDVWLPLEAEESMARDAVEPGADPTAEAGRAHDAVEAYRRRDAANVVAALDGAPLAKRYEPVNLLLASALLSEGRHEEARALLQRLDTLTMPQPWRDRGRWLLYVALRRGGRADEAQAILRELGAKSGEIGDRARAAAGHAPGP
jgi:hypothetical protein